MKHLLAVTALATGILASLPGLAQDKTVVSFLHKFPEPENKAYFDAAVAEFEAANPAIDIVMESVADEPYKDKIRVLMASDQVPDIYFSWSGEFGRKFAREGRTLDLTEALAGPAKVVPAHLRGGKWIGVLERLGVAASLVCGWPEGIAIVLAVKGLGRYPELQQGSTERFIIGTFASVLFAAAACGVGLVAR